MNIHIIGVYFIDMHLTGVYLMDMHLSYELYEVYNCSLLKDHVGKGNSRVPKCPFVPP